MAETQEQKYEFGFATFTFDEGTENELRFDGKLCEDGSYMQAEGGELELTPITEEIELPELGGGVFDHIQTGWEGSLKIVGSKASLDLISKTISGTISFDENGEVVSVTDAPVGSSLREKGRKVRIHPRQLGDDTSEDFVIHKVINTGGITKTYQNEQGQHEMEFVILPKDCADANKPNNYFYIGEDPERFIEGAEEEPETP